MQTETDKSQKNGETAYLFLYFELNVIIYKYMSLCQNGGDFTAVLHLAKGVPVSPGESWKKAGICRRKIWRLGLRYEDSGYQCGQLIAEISAD